MPSAAIVSFMIVAINCLTIAWPIVRKVASGKAESYHEAFMLIYSNVKKYICRHKPDKESERRLQREKWENSSSRKQAAWREGQRRSWQHTSEATGRILKRHKTWRKLNSNSKASIGLEKSQTPATQAKDAVDISGLEESLAKTILPKDASKRELSQIEVQPDDPPTELGVSIDEQLGSATTPTKYSDSRTEAKFYVMPSHEGAARLEPLLADAGMPPIINASVVNASPVFDTVTQPDIALSAHRQNPVRTQNVSASTREWEIGHQDNPWIRAARELEWNVDVEGGSTGGIC